MKTKILFITALLIGILATPIISKAMTPKFSKAISNTIKYPAKASENKIEGTIWVSVDVDQEGIMKVVLSNHNCCDKLHKEVIKQLDGKKIKKFKSDMVGNHNLKLIFKIE